MPATNDENRLSVESTGAECARLRDELRSEQGRSLRVLADFENYRRRVERERANATRAGKREVLLSLLELADSFDAALLHSDPESYLAAGLSALQRKLQRVLETHGVTPLSSLGEAFNPELHEALGLIETDKYPAGTVAEEVLRGYWWGDELLRPARVRIAQPLAGTPAVSEVS